MQLIIKEKFDIFLISETKLDSSFPTGQFNIPGFRVFRNDRNKNGGGLMFYVNQQIPCKNITNFNFSQNIETLMIEINLNNFKTLIVGAYKPPAVKNDVFLNELHNALSFYSTKYDNFLIIGDLNIPLGNQCLNDFCDTFSLKHLIKDATCFKSANPSCIDHIITNASSRFMKSCTLETGISDFHKLVMTVFRGTFAKGKPKKFLYRCYKSYNKDQFETELLEKLSTNTEQSFEKFFDTFNETLNKHAPLKTKAIRYNNRTFMTKALRKGIMTRSRLRNKFNLKRNQSNWEKYKKQRNFCTSLLKKSKQNFFRNLNIKDLSDNKKFWKKIAPLFSNNTKTADTIILTKDDEIIRDEKKVATIFNTYFLNLTKDLKLKKASKISKESTLSEIIKSYDESNSIKKIKEFYNLTNDVFTFSFFSEQEVIDVIHNLPSNKATVSNDIPVKILKESSLKYARILTAIFNNCIRSKSFPDILKRADICPVFKKGDITDKTNYRPISTLSNLSKVFERLLYNQLENYMETKLSKLLTGFRKNHSTQHALLKAIETWKEHLNKGDKVGAIFMDLSKAFDTLDHNLLLAKLKAYGLDFNSISFINSYLSNRYQRCKIGSSFSKWGKIKTGVPQGSILGPLLFNIFINDIFLFVKNSSICNYADDNTLFSCDKTFDLIYQSLKIDFTILKKWYFDNYLVLNADKCHFMTIGPGNNCFDFQVDDTIIKNSQEEKILGVIIDNELNFQSHINSICKKANQKLNALFRISNNMMPSQRNILIDTYIKSQFNYCPLIWMFCNRSSMNKINKIHERTLRLKLNNHSDSFSELLSISKDTTIHQRCINFLMVEVYKFLHSDSPEIMNEIFTIQRNINNLRSFNIFQTNIPRSNRYGLNSIPYRANQLWKILPENIKSSQSLSCFKDKIKNWCCNNCPCTICKTFIPNLGYL